MTQHQAPEVTSEMAAIIERLCRKRQVYNGRNTFRDEFVNPDGPEIAKLLTRATQPLSLTVDEGLVIARLRELLAKATPLPWVRANLANVTIKFTQVAPNVTSEQQAYRPEDTVLCTEVVNALPALLDRLQSLSLPKDAANV